MSTVQLFSHNFTRLESHHTPLSDHHGFARARIAGLARCGHLYGEHPEVSQFDASSFDQRCYHIVQSSLHDLACLLTRNANPLRNLFDHTTLRSDHFTFSVVMFLFYSHYSKNQEQKSAGSGYISSHNPVTSA